MYELTLEDIRRIRKMDYSTLYNLTYRCNHKYFTKSEPNVFICNKCKYSWNVGGSHPPRGNIMLEGYLENKCNHLNTRTLPGSDIMNQCLECDMIIEKSHFAKIWKQIRNHIDKKEKHIRFTWDPETYGDQKWGIEYD